MSIRTIAAFEGHYEEYPYRVYAPTEAEFSKLDAGYVHGEVAVLDRFPHLIHSVGDTEEPVRIPNFMNEWLSGEGIGRRDLVHLPACEILGSLAVTDQGCWVKPRDMSLDNEHERRLVLDTIGIQARDGRLFQLCQNDGCFCPRHTAIGDDVHIAALQARADMLERYGLYSSKQWARPSFAYPGGVEHLVGDEVNVLSSRSAMLPVAMSKREYNACMRELIGRSKLPSGGWTTDPGFHVLFGAMKRGLDFDNSTGCWNARINLDVLPPHKQTITHACGSKQCCNPRHMDIAMSERRFYELPMERYATQADGGVVVKASGEVLPSYWQSWELYWNWLREYSVCESATDPPLLSEVDFGHLWVHPLTGCWENERFYPRWSKSGKQENAYGFHRSTYGKFGRSTHRYLYYKYHEFLGSSIEVDAAKDADHKCENRRCCNPLHMQLIYRKAHVEQTNRRIRKHVAITSGQLALEMSVAEYDLEP